MKPNDIKTSKNADELRRGDPEKKNISYVLAKLVRVATVPSVAASVAVCAIYAYDARFIGGIANFILALFFLGILPMLAYPLQPCIPGFRGKGREGQRNLAMVFAFVGYLLGCIVNVFMSAPTFLWIFYLDYLLSGIGIIVFNKVFHLRASGHGCGVAGPIAALAYLGIYPALIVGIPIYAASFWASVKMKRHTPWQFIGGSLIPIAVLMLLVAGFSCFS